MRSILKLFLVIGAGFLFTITLSVWVARQESADLMFVAWTDHGEDQGLILVSMQDGIQARFPASTIYNPDYVPSPDGMWLVYDRFQRGMSDIYRVRIHDGHTQNLTHSTSSDILSTWSPDGEWLLFWSQANDRYQLKRLEWATRRIESLGNPISGTIINGGVYRWSPDGSAVYVLSNQPSGIKLHVVWMDGQEEAVYPIPIDSPTQIDVLGWSPDSQWLIFREGGLQLYRIRVGDGTIESFSQIGAFNALISWSPDGMWLYYTTLRGSDSVGLYRISFDSSQPQIITTFEEGYEALELSPDGTWLYYRHRPEQFQDTLYRVRTDGSTTEVVASGFVLIQDIFWTSDNEWLYIMSSQEIGRDMDLFRVRPNGSDQMPVVRNFRGQPVLSSDGKWLLYSAQQGLNEELFRARSDGTEQHRLTYSEDRNVDLTFEAWLDIPELAWRPLFLGIVGFGSVGTGIMLRIGCISV